MISKIKKIKAREILDSRGNPTVEVELIADSGTFTASVPSGASTGKYEAMELRDGEERYGGKGVLKAVKNVNEIIAPKLVGANVQEQKEIDNLMMEMDGTENKSKLGANAILAVSIAVCRAGTAAKNMPLYRHISEISNPESQNSDLKLPIPCFNIINGGAHAGSELDVQEFMAVPQEESFSENLRKASELYHNLKKVLKKDFGPQSINIGDEGGFAPPFSAADQALKYILKANEGAEIKIILDVAAGEFYRDGKYKMSIGDFSETDLAKYYLDLTNKYPIIGIEDPFSEDDWQGWKGLISNFQFPISKFLVIGDDLIATNAKRVKEADEKSACNAMILKPNQAGSVSESIEAVKLAQSLNWKIIASHRSGETCDDFIADLAVGIGADFAKLGAPARGERLAKYNRLLKIEEELKQ